MTERVVFGSIDLRSDTQEFKELMNALLFILEIIEQNKRNRSYIG